jgi:hypothetical protein
MACFFGAVGAIAAAPSAWAGAINIPAITFVTRGGAPADGVTLGFLANNGNAATYFASVPGLEPGQSICKFILFARDNDGDFDVVAFLVRKETASGTGVGFGPSPEDMASLGTAGASLDTQKLVTTTITNPVVAVNFVYWVEIEFTGAGFMEALSVRIVQQPAC